MGQLDSINKEIPGKFTWEAGKEPLNLVRSYVDSTSTGTKGYVGWAVGCECGV